MFAVIAVSLFLLIVAVIAVIVWKKSMIRCPHCGHRMVYLGDSTENKMIVSTVFNPLRRHVYRCPECGLIIVL